MTRLILLSDNDPSGVTEILREQIINNQKQTKPRALLPKAPFTTRSQFPFSTELCIESLH